MIDAGIKMPAIGWTLLHEMFFYRLAAMMTFRTRPTWTASLLIAALYGVGMAKPPHGRVMAPPEMTALFGYNPVVEIEMHDPASQLIALLENYSKYLPLVERNYQAVMGRHSWGARWSQIGGLMRAPRADAA